MGLRVSRLVAWLDFNADDASTFKGEGNPCIWTTLKRPYARIVDADYSPKAGRQVGATGATVLLLALVSVLIPLPAFAPRTGTSRSIS